VGECVCSYLFSFSSTLSKWVPGKLRSGIEDRGLRIKKLKKSKIKKYSLLNSHIFTKAFITNVSSREKGSKS